MRSISSWKIFLLLTTALSAGCSSDPTPPPLVSFEISPEYQANDNNLFYLVVSNATETQFMQETYPSIANKAFADPADKAVLGVFPIVPGTTQTYTVNQPAQGNIALYFLLTQPGTQWKEFLNSPFSETYFIDLKANNQIQIQDSKGFFSWF